MEKVRGSETNIKHYLLGNIPTRNMASNNKAMIIAHDLILAGWNAATIIMPDVIKPTSPFVWKPSENTAKPPQNKNTAKIMHAVLSAIVLIFDKFMLTNLSLV